jgi:hypothetical protein
MSETHIISALRGKRAEVSGYIHDLEKQIKRSGRTSRILMRQSESLRPI